MKDVYTNQHSSQGNAMVLKWKTRLMMLAATLFVFFGFTYFNQQPPHVHIIKTKVPMTTASNSSDHFYSFKEEVIKNKTKPVILLWVPPFRKIEWILPETPLCGSGCVITTDKKLYNDSDAVVFFMKGTTERSLPDPSTHRRNDKVYVWWCGESPWTVRNNYNKKLTEFNGFFNWTMHYRRDSDVFAALIPPSARDWLLRRIDRSAEAQNNTISPGFNEGSFDAVYDSLRKEKKKSAVFVVSDCSATKGAHDRMDFAKRLRDHYNFDQFGECNRKPLPQNNEYHKFLRNYKFYFAFENARACKDYITEKFWINSLYVGCVPVVWGPKRADVVRLAPPNSFIHAEDFGYDPKRLAEYLKEVEANETLYKSFFSWWKNPDFYPLMNIREPSDHRDKVSNAATGYHVSSHCHLCKKLSDGDHLHQRKVVENLAEHFYGAELPVCYK